MISRTYKPHPCLQDLVAGIMSVDVVLPEGFENAVTPYPPTPMQSIIFYGEDRIEMMKDGMKNFVQQPSSVIIGPQYTRVNIRVGKTLRAVRVDFWPGGLHRLLGIPMNHFFDDGFDAVDVLGNEMRDVNVKIAEREDLEQRAAVVEAFLIEKRMHMPDMLPVDLALKQLMLNAGSLSIHSAASIACLSVRQFERKCRERMGYSPKEFARVARFSKAYRLRESKPCLTWTTIAHESGYFDQMHFIRDFKEFAGVRPGIIEKDLSATPLRMQAELLR